MQVGFLTSLFSKFSKPLTSMVYVYVIEISFWFNYTIKCFFRGSCYFSTDVTCVLTKRREMTLGICVVIFQTNYDQIT